MSIFTESENTRFWSKVVKTDGCWLWKACKTWGGYGRFCFRGRSRLAHRLSKMATGVEVPARKLVLHSCDTPACVNPSHLHIGTHKLNTAEKFQRGRANTPCGDRNGSRTHPEKRLYGVMNPASKLNPEKVRKIRSTHSASGASYRSIAKQFSVTHRVILLVVQRKIWKQVQ